MTQHGDKNFAASWSDKGKVHIWDLNKPLQAVNDPMVMASYVKNEESNIKPLFTFTGHQTEGFALDWSQTMPGNIIIKVVLTACIYNTSFS